MKVDTDEKCFLTLKDRKELDKFDENMPSNKVKPFK